MRESEEIEKNHEPINPKCIFLQNVMPNNLEIFDDKEVKQITPNCSNIKNLNPSKDIEDSFEYEWD